jgi:hypothetical protein
MASRCECREKCAFYKLIVDRVDRNVDKYKLLYCEGPLDFRCARKKHEDVWHETPPDEMAPTGGMLSTFKLEN